MTLVCIRAFGNFVPGDEVEVPEGAFDTYYFERKSEPKRQTKSEDK